MIEALVEAELLLDVVAFLLAAGDADRARALDFCNLADRRADRAGGRRDDDSLAGLRLADIQEPGIGGHAGHAEHAHRGRDGAEFRVDLVQALPSEIACVCQPARDSTMSPLAKPGLLEAITSQTVPASMTPPTGTGWA